MKPLFYPIISGALVLIGCYMLSRWLPNLIPWLDSNATFAFMLAMILPIFIATRKSRGARVFWLVIDCLLFGAAAYLQTAKVIPSTWPSWVSIAAADLVVLVWIMIFVATQRKTKVPGQDGSPAGSNPNNTVTRRHDTVQANFQATGGDGNGFKTDIGEIAQMNTDAAVQKARAEDRAARAELIREARAALADGTLTEEEATRLRVKIAKWLNLDEVVLPQSLEPPPTTRQQSQIPTYETVDFDGL